MKHIYDYHLAKNDRKQKLKVFQRRLDTLNMLKHRLSLVKQGNFELREQLLRQIADAERKLRDL